MKVVILSCLLAAVLGMDYEAVKRGFDALDLNGDEVVRPEEVLAFVAKIDGNNDGNVTFEEFTAAQLPGMSQLVIQGNFNYYSKQDGAADGVMVLQSVVSNLFDILDADDDGEIILVEWRTTLQQVVDGIQNEIAALYAA